MDPIELEGTFVAADLQSPQDDVAYAQLRITVSDEADCILISPRGEIDLNSAQIFSECLIVVANEAAQPVVVDLSGVTFMDSTGLDALIRGTRRLLSNGLPLRIRNTNNTVRQVIEVSGAGPMFDLAD